MNPKLNEIQSPYAGKAKCIENFGGLTALYEKHLQAFKDKYADADETLSQLLESDDLEEARILAHSIKGLSGTLGLTRIYYASADLEASIKTGSGQIQKDLQTFSDCLKEIYI